MDVWMENSSTLWETLTKNYGTPPCYEWVNPRTIITINIYKSPFSSLQTVKVYQAGYGDFPASHVWWHRRLLDRGISSCSPPKKHVFRYSIPPFTDISVSSIHWSKPYSWGLVQYICIICLNSIKWLFQSPQKRRKRRNDRKSHMICCFQSSSQRNPRCSMVLVYLPTKLGNFWVNVGKYSSTMVRIWELYFTLW